MSFLVLGVFYNIFLLSVFIYEQKDRTGIDRLSLVIRMQGQGRVAFISIVMGLFPFFLLLEDEVQLA